MAVAKKPRKARGIRLLEPPYHAEIAHNRSVKVLIAPVARRKVSQQKGGAEDSDESHPDESYSDGCPRLS